MPPPLKSLSPYISALLIRRLAQNPQFTIEPTLEQLASAVLAIKLTGLMELVKQFPGETMDVSTSLIDRYDKYIETIFELVAGHGGDVIKIENDTILVLWPTEATNEPLSFVCLRAIQCGLALQTVITEQSFELKISPQIAISAGLVMMADIGGVYGRWEFVVDGLPVRQVRAEVGMTRPGTVNLSPETWILTDKQIRSQPISNRWVQVEAIEQPLPIASLNWPALPSQIEAALRGYIPGAALSRLTTTRPDGAADILSVTVLILRLSDVSTIDSVTQTHQHIRMLQSTLYEHEGSVSQVRLNEHTIDLVAIWGLPPVAHEDDAALAVQAALAMQDELQQKGLSGAISIASGRAFCSIVGSKQRKEYSISGDPLQLAEQLNSAMPITGVSSNPMIEIWCDEATYLTAQGQVAFKLLSPLHLGPDLPSTAVYQPMASLASFKQNALSKNSNQWLDSNLSEAG